MAAATGDSRRSWRGAQRGALVRRSRNVWRWLLSAIALCLVGLAIYMALPRPIPRTHLLILSAEREDRTSPLVPYVAGDRRALLDWAAAANVPTSDLSLVDLSTPATIRPWFTATDKSDERLIFERRGKSPGKHRLGKKDRLVVYIKAHGVALDVSKNDKPDVQPLLIKRLNEDDLATAWHQSETHVLSVMPLLEELARLRDIQTLVILDVVHVNYDPRLGLMFNAFPDALKQALQKMPQRDNLAVVVCQASGELSAGIPAAGRSAVADSVVRVLQREPKAATNIGLIAFIDKLRQQLSGLGGSGRTSFGQSVEALYLPAASARLASFTLPTSPPAEEGSKKESGDAGKAVAQAVQNEAARAAPAPVTRAATTAQQVSQAVSSASPPGPPAPNPSGASADSTKAAAPQPAAPSETTSGGPSPASGDPSKASGGRQPTEASPVPAPAPAPPPIPKNDLELAWEARDRLRSSYRTAWTPAHVAPQQWRRIEAVLAGFDEELLPPGEEPRDPQTLATLSRDLETLVAYFGGAGEKPIREDSGAVAASLTRFLDSPASKTFESRQPGALNQANEAVRIFAEALYRTRDYLRLHGQTASMPDGGLLINDNLLDSLLTRLSTLRGLLNPTGLDDGRLTDVRLQELSRVAEEVDQDMQRLDREIEAYASMIATAAPSAGQMLRARLLLGSPLLSAETRRSLRFQQPASEQPLARVSSSTTGTYADRLATNVRLTRKFLEIAVPAELREPAQGSSAGGSSPGGGGNKISLAGLAGFENQLVRVGFPATEWATTGRALRELSQQWPGVIKTLYERRLAGKSAPPGQDLFDVYRLSLLVDGRDARRLRSQETLDVAIAQPLRAPRILDQVALRFSRERIQLPLPEADPPVIELALQVTSENPPPYTVSLTLDWNDREMDVARQGSGPSIRRGVAFQVPLNDTQGTLPLRIGSRRMSREGTSVALAATASFGMSPSATHQAMCDLPRPDVVELTLAGDDNLDAARRRTWLPSGQQGGRLRLFPNREKAFSVYLTNQSSEEKRIIARLYRVPRAAVDPSGRLFDPRSPSQLLAATAGYDARLSQPTADPSQILRGQLVAQSGDKEIVLPANQAPVRVPLGPIPAASPPTTAAAPAAATPTDTSSDVTSGLVLVLTSADNKSPPHAKWIELQTHQPDDLLEIRSPQYEQGRLSFSVGLKDTYLVEEMGLSKQPLLLAWDTRPLPEVQVPMQEAPIAAEGNALAAFSATVPSSISWPIYLHLASDGYPRGLVAGLSWRGAAPIVENFLTNRAPVVHLTRVGAAADRPGAQPQKVQYVFRPERGWLPYPSAAPEIAALPLAVKGQPVMVRVDPAAATVRIDCDLGADISLRHFAEGARLRVSLAGQNKQFTLDRQAVARLVGLEEGTIRLSSRVTDFEAIEFERLDVPQDRRVDLVAEVIGENLPPSPGGFASDKVTFVLDRTPPTVSEVTAQRRLAPQNPMGSGPPPTIIAMQCRADDGQGSGLAGVEFVVGFDRNQNETLDADERRPAVPGRHYGQGIYTADYSLTDLPGEYLLVQAVARDNVQQTSQPGYFSLHLPKPAAGGGQRTTFGGKKIEPDEPRPKKGR